MRVVNKNLKIGLIWRDRASVIEKPVEKDQPVECDKWWNTGGLESPLAGG